MEPLVAAATGDAEVKGRVLVASLLLSTLALGAPTANQAKEAKRHFERGLRLYDVRSYGEAIEELKAGYVLDPDPRFLFAIGQAHRLAGDCRSAVEVFNAFLRTGPAPTDEAAAQRLIDGCTQEPPVTAPARVVPLPAERPAETPSVPPPPRSPAPRRAVATWVLLGLTAGGLAAAAGVEGAAVARFDALRDTCAPPNGPGCPRGDIDGVGLKVNVATGLFVTTGVLAVGTLIAGLLERRAMRVWR